MQREVVPNGEGLSVAIKEYLKHERSDGLRGSVEVSVWGEIGSAGANWERKTIGSAGAILEGDAELNTKIANGRVT